MLNARLWEFGTVRPSDLSWSLGMVITPSNNSTATEYITGPSIGFRDNAFIVTVGYHAARAKHLGGGFKVGQAIPSTLQGDPPTETHSEGRADGRFHVSASLIRVTSNDRWLLDRATSVGIYACTFKNFSDGAQIGCADGARIRDLRRIPLFTLPA